MTSYEFRDFSEADRDRVKDLWQACGLVRAWNDPDRDIDRKLTDATGRFWLLIAGDAVIGTVMVGYDGHRGSVYYLCVAPEHQKSGCGRLIMDRCETFLTDLGCPKINLMVRGSNLPVKAFYDELGYSVDDCIVLGKRLIPDI